MWALSTSFFFLIYIYIFYFKKKNKKILIRTHSNPIYTQNIYILRGTQPCVNTR